jgi:hypothetical protein
MMANYLIALAIAGAMSVPAAAQPVQPVQPDPTMANPAPATTRQMVKKTVCEENDNSDSHINRVCHTVMVPANPADTAKNQQPQTDPQMNFGN